MTIWSIVLHARHLVLHLRTTVDERSQLWEHWVLLATRFFALSTKSMYQYEQQVALWSTEMLLHTEKRQNCEAS